MRIATLLALLLSGCSYLTVTGNTLAPYRSDVSHALALSRRAADRCGKTRGYENVPPATFTTDGCSMWIDDGWVDCCVSHDERYWCGGDTADRGPADGVLSQCVAHAGAPALGPVMEAGSQVGGAAWMPLPWRWGYGWNWPWQLDRATGAPASH